MAEVLPVQVGVELEFCGPGCGWLAYMLSKERFPVSLDHNNRVWSLGYDSSVLRQRKGPEQWLRGENCCEFRTPILTPVKLRMMRRWLEVFLKLNCFVTPTCGMHVHISSPKTSATVDGERLADELEKRYLDAVWTGRKRYCNKGFGDYQDRSHGEPKYRVVNRREGNHHEVRVFNGTLDYGVVTSRVRETIDLYRQCAAYAGCNGYGRKIKSLATKKIKERVQKDAAAAQPSAGSFPGSAPQAIPADAPPASWQPAE